VLTIQSTIFFPQPGVQTKTCNGARETVLRKNAGDTGAMLTRI